MTRLRGKDSSQLKKGKAASTQQPVYLTAGQELAKIKTRFIGGRVPGCFQVFCHSNLSPDADCLIMVKNYLSQPRQTTFRVRQERLQMN